METITISVNKVAIGIALVVGLVVGGIIGCIAGSHHSRYEGRENFRGGYAMPLRGGINPMMDKETFNKMMVNGPTDTTITAPNPTK